MASNIKVAVRVRPMNNRELQHICRIVVDVVDENMLFFDPKEKVGPFYYQGVQQPNMNYLKRSNKELIFEFDNVCGTNATNRDVFEAVNGDKHVHWFEATAKDMIASVSDFSSFYVKE